LRHAGLKQNSTVAGVVPVLDWAVWPSIS
jgi:hypothetical protein